MRLLSPGLELSAIKTICSNTNESSRLFSSLSIEDFKYNPTKEAFQRLSSIAKLRGHILSWDDIINDPILNEDSRKLLKAYTKKPKKDKENIDNLLIGLKNYRKIRDVFDVAKYAIDKFKQPKIDVDKLLDGISDKISKAKIQNSNTKLYNLGTSNNSLKLAKEVLKDSRKSFLPTGIKDWDEVNVGFPRNSVCTLASTTSGGKSCMALQLAINMARKGSRVCTVSLEMDEKELMMRRYANLTKISMTKFIDPTRLSSKEKRKSLNAYKKYVRRNKKIGGMETFFSPEEDISMEECLFMLKPYAYDAIIIDYIGLLKGVDGDDQWRQLSNVTRFAKRFSNMAKCAVIICAQLSEEGTIRYSRAIKEHSTIMWQWIRDEKSKETHIVEIKVVKARNQKQFDFYLVEDFDTMSFRSLDKNEKQTLVDHSKSDKKDKKWKKKDKDDYFEV